MDPRVPIYPYTGLKERAGEMTVIDPRVTEQGGVSPTGGSIAGYKYVLNPWGSVFPVREVMAISRLQLQSPPGFTDQATIRDADMVNWLVTLKDHAGVFVAENIPLIRLCSRFTNGRRLYWNADTMVDPRQSYVQPVADGLDGLVVLRFIFA